ncbi:hypothetical protein POVWA2_021040 [Plasmodium ovale wallikeri]|uniref:Uncharacterized protein n=1 Tax=Plasmodium ovale wallikeri TaxID=864142 RepID=A0A1A8YRF4_PLAOA|nr:hypothetical protein POVWA1_021060 [Plasmodium ovale wallikeri]SBT34673.1 hypothetical protein POVWA2_021040 [Plasmodium ovale wallikeri]
MLSRRSTSPPTALRKSPYLASENSFFRYVSALPRPREPTLFISHTMRLCPPQNVAYQIFLLPRIIYENGVSTRKRAVKLTTLSGKHTHIYTYIHIYIYVCTEHNVAILLECNAA